MNILMAKAIHIFNICTLNINIYTNIYIKFNSFSKLTLITE